jgi:hypothetical protein
MIDSGKGHQNAHAALRFSLLRPRRHQPCRNRTAEEPEELAPSHEFRLKADEPHLV